MKKKNKKKGNYIFYQKCKITASFISISDLYVNIMIFLVFVVIKN